MRFRVREFLVAREGEKNVLSLDRPGLSAGVLADPGGRFMKLDDDLDLPLSRLTIRTAGTTIGSARGTPRPGSAAHLIEDERPL
jgi:hypothetical protein